MTIILLALFLSTGATKASEAYWQKVTVSLQMKNVSVGEVLQKIENDTEFIFIFRDDAVDLDRKVSVNVQNKTIDFVLNKLFGSTNSFSILPDN